MRAKSVLPSHLGISCLLKRVEFLPSQVTKSLLHLLDEVETIADETPPIDNAKSRFGNPAFQPFYDKIVSVSAVLILVLTGLELIKHSFTPATRQKSGQLHQPIPGLPPSEIPQLSVYLIESWGNRTRIDYGSGMELNFLCWL